VRSTVPRVAWDSVVSLVSAAILLGLPVWALLTRVHVTRNGSGGGRIHRCLHVHVGPLDAEELVDIDGIAVTSLARTVVDLARARVGADRHPSRGKGQSSRAHGHLREPTSQTTCRTRLPAHPDSAPSSLRLD